LEQALGIKDQFPDSRITLLTMGPGRAADILREGMFRGADDGVLLTDRAFAGADTLATSYALSMAIRKIGKYDIFLRGVRLLMEIRRRWDHRSPKSWESLRSPMPKTSKQ